MKQFCPVPKVLLARATRKLAAIVGVKPTAKMKLRAGKAHQTYGCESYHGYATGRTYRTAVPFDACAFCPIKNACYPKMMVNVRRALPELGAAWDAAAPDGTLRERRMAFAKFTGLPLTLSEYMAAINIAEGSNGEEPGTSYREAIGEKHGLLP